MRPLGVRGSLFLLAALTFACSEDGDAIDEAGGETLAYAVPPGCDPDGLEPCPDDWFICYVDEAGNKLCEGQSSALPDGGDWSCEVADGTVTCIGDAIPDTTGDWDCEDDGGEVTCSRDAYEPASDSGDDELWSCAIDGEFMVCESGDYQGEAGGTDDDDNDTPTEIPISGIEFCFFDEEDPTGPPLVQGWYDFEILGGAHAIHVKLTFNQNFVDNTYGVNSSSGYDHKFNDLVGSDKAEVNFIDGAGETVLLAKFDYISESSDASSGYDCLGVTGGDGKVETGDETMVLDATSSLDWNLNELGCIFLEDSPVGDECPDWEYSVVYEMWVAAEAFGAAGFAAAIMTEVHASPSRSENTIPVVPGPCP